ncbi:acyl carrier protein [Paenibacillus xanthanilyticus]|uniref:Acyl carrier protein n=1 Tax=Paenibacillus xanthanilyticus TaxID=1783531 RepID=A0ABV8K8T9_9BACL
MSGNALEEIKRFVRNSVASLSKNPPAAGELDEDAPIQSAGIDSMQLINLVVQLELHYDLVFEDDEMLLENFKTIAIIADSIVVKLGGAR